jgi:hypothetical protein
MPTGSKYVSTDDSRVVDSVGALLIQINDILNDVQTKCAKVVLFSRLIKITEGVLENRNDSIIDD